MTDDQIDLAHRAVADPRWRWEAGMRLLCLRDGPSWLRCRLTEHYSAPEDGLNWLPDLTDAATAGMILSWLPVYSVAPVIGASPGFAVTVCGTTHAGATLGEAAVRAWLALGEAP